MKYVKKWGQSDNTYNFPNDAICEISDVEIDGYISMSMEDIQENIEYYKNEIESIINDKNNRSEIRIKKLIENSFYNLNPSKIDFRKHLLPNTHINKDIEMDHNGRPVRATYKYNNELIAKIDFVFQLNNFGLIERRQEILGYYNNEDEITESYIISDEIYDIQNSSYHRQKVFSERVQCRRNIIEDVKAILNGFLVQYYLNKGMSFIDIIASISRFFDFYNSSYNTWIETGSGTFTDDILNDTEFDFLNIEISTGVNVKMYLLSRLI
jgi:hypothetical protein